MQEDSITNLLSQTLPLRNMQSLVTSRTNWTRS